MSESDDILADPIVAWRAIILYGQNTATYKIALGCAIKQFVDINRDHVSLDELSTAFLDLYMERLERGKPQLLNAGRLTRMERIVGDLRFGRLGRDEAIARVGAEAFGDVIPRFHTVYDRAVPRPFYVPAADGGLALTEAAFSVFQRADACTLAEELSARWSLLEAAFEMKREPGSLANDLRAIYLERGYERSSITHLAPVLHGYQEGRCFYCGEPIPAGDGHVDHVIPRQFLQHDEPWNLVLAHGFCNLSKSDHLPSADLITQLIDRNEHLIASNHPLRQHVINQLGATPKQRRRQIAQVYSDARVVIPWEWNGLPGFEPASSDFYRAVIRSLGR